MADLCPFPSQKIGYVLAGCGPAGCGFLVHAIKSKTIERLVDNGLVIIDRSAKPGSGKVGDYQLTGNSLSRAFLDCIDDPALGWLFDDLSETEPSINQLRELEFDAPPLDIVGDFLTAMAKRTIDYLVSEYGVPVLLETEINQIQRFRTDDYLLNLRNQRTGQAFSISARNVICALGGRQSMSVVKETEIAAGITLGRATDNLITSDQFLMMSDEAIRDAIPINSDSSADVVIVGGSHSAISTADRLCQALAPVGMKRLTMLHGSPLRLYYASPEEARADNYPFDDPDDICAMSGRVNRFGGLRYRSLDVAKSILKTGRMPELDVEIHWMQLKSTEPGIIAQALREAPAVITAMGYQANLPPVIDAQGSEIPICNWPRGVDVDDCGSVKAVSLGSMQGLYAIGIGSTLLRRSDAIGGEPSFSGVADGVWLYHNHGGGVILDTLIDSESTNKNQYVEPNRVTSNAQV